jgi:hypothetical protein
MALPSRDCGALANVNRCNRAIVKKSEAKAAMTFIRTSKIHVNWLLVKSLIALKPLLLGIKPMKRSLLFLVVVCSASLQGCGGGGSHDLSTQVQNAKNKSEFQGKQGVEKQSTPEFIAEHAESARERANYLKGLESDAKFDPKQHVEMLKKYENDSSSEVAEAAKQLLAKAQ